MDTNINLFTTQELKYAGKVNFNTTAKNDFVTNEAFKTLRSNILFCSKNIKTILITSAFENEGKSTIATELSKSLSDINKKVLLIDADMRKSVILRNNLKSQTILGLSEYLSGQTSVNDIIYETQIPNFNVIFCGHFPPNPVELLSSDTFGDMLKFFSGIYDYVIVDTPPLSPVIDASVISANCDGAILVITNNKVRISEAVEVKKQLSKSGCKIIGAILNDASPRHKYKNGYSSKKSYYSTYSIKN